MVAFQHYTQRLYPFLPHNIGEQSLSISHDQLHGTGMAVHALTQVPTAAMPIIAESAKLLSEQQTGTVRVCHEEDVKEAAEVLLSFKNSVTIIINSSTEIKSQRGSFIYKHGLLFLFKLR